MKGALSSNIQSETRKFRTGRFTTEFRQSKMNWASIIHTFRHNDEGSVRRCNLKVPCQIIIDRHF